MAFEDSTFFIKKPPFAHIDSESFLFTKELLSGRIFLGHYEERRFVPALQQYRDLVVVHAEEQELANDLNKVKKKWLGKEGVKWLGITVPEELNSPSYSFWVKLSNLPFGCYWFQIKHVKFIDEELILILKCIRKFQTMGISKSATLKGNLLMEERGNADTVEVSKTSSCIENWDFDVKRFTTMCSEAFENVLPYITWTNFVTTVKVISAFMIVLVMTTISFIGSLGDFLLKLIRELSLLVQSLTPIIIQVIDFSTKVIGGLYLLLYGIFTKAPRTPTQSYSSLSYELNSPPVDWRKRNQMLRKELLSLQVKRK